MEKDIAEIRRIAKNCINRRNSHNKAGLGLIIKICDRIVGSDDDRRQLPPEHFSAWTDGACFPNPGGRGGYAYVLRGPDGAIVEGGGRERSSTNNRMELMAAISVLENVPADVPILIHTDSQYVQKGITTWIKNWRRNGWKTKAGGAVKNDDLWRRLDNLCSARRVQWAWVRGHNGDEMNEMADNLARAYAYRQDRGQ